MLKSKFNLSEKEDEINEAEEIVEEEARISAKEEAEQAGEVESIFKHEFVERKLGKYEVTVKLSMLGRTADGDGYTYLKATLTGMSLTNIDAIKFYRHLQFVDLSNNSLDLDGMQAVTSLPYLCLIQADYNFMYSAALKKTKYLQVIILNNNYLTSVYDVFQPELSTLEVGNNKIQKINFLNRMPNLKCLDFRNNVVEDVLDLDFPLLDSLYLAGNKIRSLVGLEKLVNLRILHLRNNPIRLLDGFDPNMAKLQYINLRNCKVSSMIQIKKLRALPGLDTLILKGCPYFGGTGQEDAEVAQEEEDSELRIEVIAIMPKLKRLNKQVINPDERTEANDLIKMWAEEGEKEDEEEVIEEQELEEDLNLDQ